MVSISHKIEELVITPITNLEGNKIIDNKLLDTYNLEHNTVVKVYDIFEKKYRTLFPSIINIKRHLIIKDGVKHIVLN
jgi:hypothetical protein